MLGDPDGVGDDGQGGVDGADGGHEAAVDDVQVVEVVGFAVDVEGRGARIVPKRTVPAWWAVAETSMALCR